MTVLSSSLTVTSDALTPQQQRLQTALPRLQAAIAAEIVPEAQARTVTTINKEPGAHIRPTAWQSEKQRRWWFAVGIKTWHGRTGAVRAWRIVHRANANGGEIRAENNVPYARYVFQPPFQQKMHVRTWMNSTVWAQQEGEVLAKAVGAVWAQEASSIR